MDQNILIMLFVILGCTARTLLPFLQKLYKDEIKQFDMKFAVSLIVAVLVAVLAGFTVFPTFIPPVGNLYAIIIAALLWGWGSQSVINNIMTALQGTK